MAYLPCQNPDCKSKGRPHPNCHCYDHITGADRAEAEADGYIFPGTTKGMSLRGVRGGNAQNARARGRRVKYMAKGGKVDFCFLKIPHLTGCQFYAAGGDVESQEMPQALAHPSVGLGHAAVTHGLLGLLKKVGYSNMADPEKHHKTLEKAKVHLSENNPEKAVGALHEHPLAGPVGKENLTQIVGRLAPAMISQPSDPGALRSSVDYLQSAIKGHDVLKKHMGDVLGTSKLNVEPDKEGVEKLKSYLEEIKEDPSMMLEVGGNLGHYLPEHATQLGATAAIATNYLNGLKPAQMQSSPLDEISMPDKNATAKWDRHLHIAQNPLVVLHHAKEGTLLPQDMTTLRTLYPALHQSMIEKAGETLIDAKTKKMEIPYHQKQGLSMLLGQPLDSSMTPMGIQSIIASAGPQQMNQPQQKSKSQKVTGPQLKTIEKVDAMYETPIESRQLDNKS